LVAAADVGGKIPSTLAEVILARVNGLAEPAPAVLREAAVLGEGVDDEWLAELSSRPLPMVIEALRDAVSHHLLIVDGPGFRFRHALVREALYGDLLPGERERLHAAAARLFQGGQVRIAEHVRQTLLAYHASAAGDIATAFTASMQAGSECERVFALSAAAAQYERALSLWDQVGDPVTAAGMIRSQLCMRAAELVLFGSRSKRAVVLADEALAALPSDMGPEQRVELLVRIGRIYGLLHRGRAWLAAHERAVALVADRPPSPQKGLALAELGGTLMLRERTREAEPLLRQAITVAKQVDARAVTGLALCYLGHVLALYGRVDEALATYRDAMQLCRDYGTAQDVCVCYGNYSGELCFCGRYEEAERVAADGIAFAIETGHENFYAVSLAANRILALFSAGRWREAEHVYARFADRVTETMTWLNEHWLPVLLGQGRVREARAMSDMLLEETAGADDVQFGAQMLILAGQLADLEERWDQARDLFRRGLESSRRTDDQHYSSQGYAAAIRVERRRIESVLGRRGAGGEIQQARQVADQLIGQARELAARLSADGIDVLPEPAAWLQTAEAEHAAAWGNDTAQRWADVADSWDRVGQPYSNAEAQYRQADALLRQHGDRERARTLAVAALEVAGQLGAAPLAADIRQLARRGRLDLEPTPPQQPKPDVGLAVTAREAEVLALLATGRTNREIARTLYISEKTASVHVSNLLRKLGVGSRVEAAAIAQRLDLPHATSRRTGDYPPH
jgi:DNA-binding CsgD family transcriptional regulator